jgi:aryl-alcohol dehydrogenase-like predicted oxidoreductase
LKRAAGASLLGTGVAGVLGSLGQGAVRAATAEEATARSFGPAGFRVSTLSQGGALTHGCNALEGDVTKQRQRLMRQAMERGVNLFDTYKDEYITDYSCLAGHDDVHVNYKVETMSAEGTRKEAEAALRAMKRERLDIIMQHGQPWVRPPRTAASAIEDEEQWKGVIEAMEEMNRLKEEGKAGAVGYVSHFAPHVDKIIREHGDLVDVVMVRFGPFPEFDPYRSTIELARKEGLGVIAFKVMDGAGKCFDERVDQWKSEAVTWRRIKPHLERGLSPAQACVRYALETPGVDTALVGMRSLKELRQNFAAAVKS